MLRWIVNCVFREFALWELVKMWKWNGSLIEAGVEKLRDDGYGLSSWRGEVVVDCGVRIEEV